MTAVAVWLPLRAKRAARRPAPADHRPSARELLDARLAAGWTPTPTATTAGPQVLGYAACAYPAERVK